jgi:hypothetical protein
LRGPSHHRCANRVCWLRRTSSAKVFAKVEMPRCPQNPLSFLVGAPIISLADCRTLRCYCALARSPSTAPVAVGTGLVLLTDALHALPKAVTMKYASSGTVGIIAVLFSASGSYLLKQGWEVRASTTPHVPSRTYRLGPASTHSHLPRRVRELKLSRADGCRSKPLAPALRPVRTAWHAAWGPDGALQRRARRRRAPASSARGSSSSARATSAW